MTAALLSRSMTLHHALHFSRALTLASLLCLPLGNALAQETDGEVSPEQAPAAAAKPERKGPIAEETGMTSDVVGYKFPRGIFTQSDLGIYWRYLGFSDAGGTNQCYRCKYPTYYVSNAQPFIGFSFGYDLPLPESLRIGVSLQLSLATGYVANASPYSIARSQSIKTSGGEENAIRPEESPKDHAVLLAHPAVAFNVIPPFFERLLLEGRLFAGGSAFMPSAQRFSAFVTDYRWWLSTFGFDFGIGASIKYMTLLPGFVVGSDLALYTLASPGWGTEVFIPPVGRINPDNPMPMWGLVAGAGEDGTKPVGIVPFIWSTSFSPIIIKYVF